MNVRTAAHFYQQLMAHQSGKKIERVFGPPSRPWHWMATADHFRLERFAGSLFASSTTRPGVENIIAFVTQYERMVFWLTQ